MSDVLSPQQRHDNMSAIRSKDTKPEIIVRKWLWSRGFRYRINSKRLPGKPDIVLRKYRTCIFINGCFWHGHMLSFDQSEERRVKSEEWPESSECCKIPKTNTAFWVEKIRRNTERDAQVRAQLKRMGWNSLTVWTCQLRPKERDTTLRSLIHALDSIYLKNHIFLPQNLVK